MSTPLVSIIIPAYRAEKYLTETVQSALAQTYQNIEIIIIDDASPDGTGALADSLAAQDVRIRVTHHTTNKFRSGALNTGISEARGSYISFLDADDIYLPDKTEKQVTFLEENPEVDFVYGDIQYIGGEDIGFHKIQAVEFGEAHRASLRHLSTLSTLKGQARSIFGDEFIPSCSPLIRRAVFDTVRFDETLTNAEDYDLWLHIMGAGYNLKRLPFTTYLYRLHDGQKSKDKARMQTAGEIIHAKLLSGAYLN